jgi:hypothetical protein
MKYINKKRRNHPMKSRLIYILALIGIIGACAFAKPASADIIIRPCFGTRIVLGHFGHPRFHRQVCQAPVTVVYVARPTHRVYSDFHAYRGREMAMLHHARRGDWRARWN